MKRSKKHDNIIQSKQERKTIDVSKNTSSHISTLTTIMWRCQGQNNIQQNIQGLIKTSIDTGAIKKNLQYISIRHLTTFEVVHLWRNTSFIGVNFVGSIHGTHCFRNKSTWCTILPRSRRLWFFLFKNLITLEISSCLENAWPCYEFLGTGTKTKNLYQFGI